MFAAAGQSSELFNVRGAPDEVWNRYQNIRRVGSMPTCADEDNLYLKVKADLAEWMRNFKQFIHEEKKACGRDTRCGTRYNQMWSDAVRKSMETIRKINEEHGYRQQNCIESRPDLNDGSNKPNDDMRVDPSIYPPRSRTGSDRRSSQRSTPSNRSSQNNPQTHDANANTGNANQNQSATRTGNQGSKDWDPYQAENERHAAKVAEIKRQMDVTQRLHNDDLKRYQAQAGSTQAWYQQQINQATSANEKARLDRERRAALDKITVQRTQSINNFQSTMGRLGDEMRAENEFHRNNPYMMR